MGGRRDASSRCDARMSDPADSPLRAMRSSLGLSQRKVERMLGWKTGWVNLLEHGYRNPDREAQLKALLGRLLTGEQ
jgi:transcriptional regulator with XRE-family HTH domain